MLKVLLLLSLSFASFANTEKPKVAMFFSGRVKSYEQVGSWLLNFIEKYSVDVFCSINSELDEYHKEFIREFGVKKYNFEIFKIPEDLVITNIQWSVKFYNACSMLYNHNKAMELIEKFQEENHFRYDIIVYARADILAEEPLRLELNPGDRLYIPQNYDHGDNGAGINDQFAYGNPKVMAEYCSLFKLLDKYCNQDKVQFHPEMLLEFHLKQLKIPIVRFPFSYTLNNNRF